MRKCNSIQELKSEMTNLKSVTPWENVEVNAIYHIPPIITLSRREVLVLSKNDDAIKYRKIGDTTNEERTMSKTSVFAKFIVKRKNF